MFTTIRGIAKNKDLRKKVLFVLLMLFLYKIGTHIPAPGINREYLKAFESNGGLLSFMNTISGGALKTYSIFAVGIMPYITASIIIQLLQMDIVPKLTEWSKEGETGKKKTKKLTRILTIVFAFVESTAMTVSFNKLYPGLIVNTSFWGYAIVVISLTIGTTLLMVMGELIDKKGIGNGISVIIFGGIIASIPSSISMYYVSEFQGKADQMFISIMKTVLLVVCILAVLIGIIFINQAYRRIPIRYPSQGNGQYGNSTNETYLPIKVNTANVIPVIFAIAILMFPTTISQLFPSNKISIWISGNLNYTQPLGMVLYVAFIIAFSYFYAFVQLNPEKTAKDLKESGGYIPGYKPGKETEEYLSGTLNRLTFVGSIYLAIVAILPIILGQLAGLPQQTRIGEVGS